MSGEEALEKWLREDVGPAYDRMKADPSGGLTLEEVRASLKAHIAKRKCERKQETPPPRA